MNLKWTGTILVATIGAAQTSTASRPAFDVASIKPAAPGARGDLCYIVPGGAMTIHNETLKQMISCAWHVPSFRISGGPAWLDSARFDISAKPENPPKAGDLPLMFQALQTLLADRFQLKVRQETTELPIYELVMARKDGKLGPSLAKSKDGGCTPDDPNKPLPPPEPGKGPALACDQFFMGRTAMKGEAVKVDALVQPMFLPNFLGRAVIDKTGLTGRFDIFMTWTPDETQLPPGAPKPPSSDGASFFTALQEQLGLKLESAKGPVEVLVIESAEKPSEN